MKKRTGRTRRWLLGLAGTTVGLLAWTAAARAQFQSGSGGMGFGSSQGGGSFGGGSSGGGSFGGGSFGGSTSGSFGGGSFGGSSSGGFGGGSFGGSTAGGFGGGGGGFGATGGTGFGGTQGGYGGTAGLGAVYGGGTSTYQGPSASNPFGQYYANPLAAGTSGTTTRSNTFGRPLYTLTTTTGTTAGLSVGSAGGLGGMSSQTGAGGFGAAVVHTSPFVATLGFPQPVPSAGMVRGEIQQVLARSSALPSRDRIQAFVQADAVVLQGQVIDDHERRLAEALVRLSPGVHEVRNELTVGAASPTTP